MNSDKLRYSSLLSWVFLTGVFLRAFIYFQIPAVWLDEATTAFKLNESSVLCLISPCGNINHDLMHAYPMGFLGATKLLISLFGLVEPVIRLFPLICSIFSVYIFRKVCRMLLTDSWALAALALFSLNPSLLYHAVELKPYASDVLVTVVLIMEAARIIRNKPLRSLIYYGNLLLFSLLFSFPAVFLIFPWLAAYGFYALWKRDIDRLRLGATLFILAGMIQGGYFYASLRFFLSDHNLMDYWNMSYLPVREGLPACLQMLGRNFSAIFESWGMAPAIPMICLTSGLVLLLRSSHGKAALLILPLTAVLGASAVHVYPFATRTVLFLVPFLILIIVFALQEISGAPGRTWRAGTAGALLCLLLIPQADTTIRTLRPFSYGEDIRPLLRHLAIHRQEGEGLYLNTFAFNLLRYYNAANGEALNPHDGLFGDGLENGLYPSPVILFEFEPFYDELLYIVTQDGLFEKAHDGPARAFQPGRNWFLFAHAKAEAHDIAVRFLESIGHRLEAYRGDNDAVLYLYQIPPREGIAVSADAAIQ